MGDFMREDDHFIGSLLEVFNLRFAPPSGLGPDYFGGIDEMTELQKEFEVFKAGRSFRDSAAVLNMCGMYNPRARNRWYQYLDQFGRYGSNVEGQNGDVCIVSALIANLTSAEPLPVHFTAHDARGPGAGRILVHHRAKPLFYLDQEYLVISLPMKPQGT